jgi:hypothetical protein
MSGKLERWEVSTCILNDVALVVRHIVITILRLLTGLRQRHRIG